MLASALSFFSTPSGVFSSWLMFMLVPVLLLLYVNLSPPLPSSGQGSSMGGGRIESEESRMLVLKKQGNNTSLLADICNSATYILLCLSQCRLGLQFTSFSPSSSSIASQPS